MDLSVIIPTHQRPKKAAACVAALANQHFEGRFEVLIGIDGPEATADSTPDAVRAAWRSEREGASIIVEKLDKQGQASIRNHLLDRAQGRVLVFLNDDMIPQPGFLKAHYQAQCECIDAGQPALIVGDSPWQIHNPDRLFDRLVRETSMVFFYDQMHAQADQRARDWGFRHAWLLNLSAPAGLVRSAGAFTVFPSTYGYEDDELAYRLCQENATRVLFRPEAIAIHDHRMDPGDYLNREYKLGFAAWGFAKTTPACAQAMFNRDVTSPDEISYSRVFLKREESLARRLERSFHALAEISSDELGPNSPLLATIYEQHLLLKRWHWRRGLVDAADQAADERSANQP